MNNDSILSVFYGHTVCLITLCRTVDDVMWMIMILTPEIAYT